MRHRLLDVQSPVRLPVSGILFVCSQRHKKFMGALADVKIMRLCRARAEGIVVSLSSIAPLSSRYARSLCSQKVLHREKRDIREIRESSDPNSIKNTHAGIPTVHRTEEAPLKAAPSPFDLLRALGALCGSMLSGPCITKKKGGMAPPSRFDDFSVFQFLRMQ